MNRRKPLRVIEFQFFPSTDIYLRSTEQRIAVVLPKVERLVETSQVTIEQGRTQLLEVTRRTTEILDSVRTQLNRVDEVLSDATVRARVQLERAETLS